MRKDYSELVLLVPLFPIFLLGMLPMLLFPLLGFAGLAVIGALVIDLASFRGREKVRSEYSSTPTEQ
jgi:hypothetical protein